MIQRYNSQRIRGTCEQETAMAALWPRSSGMLALLWYQNFITVMCVINLAAGLKSR